MIGYYVHHHGSGHLHRAGVMSDLLGETVTGLSSLARPDGWRGDWVQLERDDEGPSPEDSTAGGRLHWVPLGDRGLRRRAAQISAWIDRATPRVVVVDVSVEVCLLVRLHGVPVVGLVPPGSRGDPAHLVGFDTAAQLVGLWPESASGMLRDVPDRVLSKVRPLGALSRFAVTEPGVRRPGPPRVTLLAGTGGSDLHPRVIDRARAQTPDWQWTVLSRDHGSWVADPRAAIADADVVITHAGQNAIAEVAALRRPAVVVPQERPHEEQVTTASVLAGPDWPALVEPSFPHEGWAERLATAASFDGRLWSAWCDGRAAGRFADVIRGVAGADQAAS